MAILTSGLLRPLVAAAGREDQGPGEGPGEGWKARKVKRVAMVKTAPKHGKCMEHHRENHGKIMEHMVSSG